jgi:3-oxoacyl-[acyl-carrier-protein] synthase-1
MGLSCALGQGLGACLAALGKGELRARHLDLGGLNEALAMPYYRIPDAADLFDPSRFQVLIESVAREAVGDAGLSDADCATLPLFVGSSSFNVRSSEAAYAAELEKDPQSRFGLPWVDFQRVAAVVQKSLGCGGGSWAFNTACSSAANALISAMRMLQAGRFKRALVVGLELANRSTLAGFCGLQLLSKAIRPFDLRRDGIVLGESVSAVVVSLSPGRHGISLSAGSIQCDSYSATTANPDGSSIGALLRELLGQAGLEPGAIRAVKAHATASPANDTAEAAGLHRVFDPLPPVCALKPYTGHTMGACGCAELILFSGALGQGYLPPCPGFETEDPQLRLTPLLRRQAAPKGHYVLNYFGFGGNNSALLIESLA